LTADDSTRAGSECELALDLLSRSNNAAAIADILRDAQQIRRLVHLYSFRTPETAERLCAEIAARYRREMLSLCSGAILLRRQSSSVYLRLEQLLSQLLRVAIMRLSRAGALPISHTQLMHGDGMLLALLMDHSKKTGCG